MGHGMSTEEILRYRPEEMRGYLRTAKACLAEGDIERASNQWRWALELLYAEERRDPDGDNYHYMARIYDELTAVMMQAAPL